METQHKKLYTVYVTGMYEAYTERFLSEDEAILLKSLAEDLQTGRESFRIEEGPYDVKRGL